MKNGKIITLILSLSMIVAVSMSTIAFAEGNGENWQGREYYKTHYISTNVLVKDDAVGSPTRFLLQADMPLELTFLGQDSSLEPNQLQSIRIKGASSSARNVSQPTGPDKTIIYGDIYEGYNHITSIDNYNLSSNIDNNSLAEIINVHLNKSNNIVNSNLYEMTSTIISPTADNQHSVFTSGYGVIRTNVPVFEDNGDIVEGAFVPGMIDYYSQYTYFSQNPYIPYTCFTVGAQPLDLTDDIYYKECYYYGYKGQYNKYYTFDGSQIGAFRVFCWSNTSADLTDNTLSPGFYLVIPSSIPSILVTRDMVDYSHTSIHLSYTSALGSQLDNVSQSWYNTGKADGQVLGYNIGYGVGYDDGNEVGYNNGLSDGRLEQTFTFESLIFSVLETPVRVLLSTFEDVTILGLDIGQTIKIILSLVLLIFVIRFTLSLFQANTTINSPTQTGGNNNRGTKSNLSKSLNSKANKN